MGICNFDVGLVYDLARRLGDQEMLGLVNKCACPQL